VTCDRRCRFLCVDCDRCVDAIDEYAYMVTDELWQSLRVSTDAMLCIGCLERRVGRELEPDDFSPVLLNVEGTGMPRSDRLRARLGH
jgi:hypothetical protein